MAGITGMGTTFTLPNYAGELFALTPSETPLLSAIGGLTGGGMTSSTEFEWQTYDLRDPGQNTAVEGATAPTAGERVRANVRNVAQIHQDKVSLSYTKQATSGMLTTAGAAPFRGVDGSNPVSSELDWQTEQAIKQIALDVNFSFINGKYANPTTNATARKTRGLIAAMTSNVVSKAATTLSAVTSATDTFTSTAHGLSNGDKVVFTDIGTIPTNVGIVEGRVYYVRDVAANTFKVAVGSVSGTAITVGTATGIALVEGWATTLTVAHIDEFVQGVYDNGGLSGMPVFLVNSRQKRALTAAYADAYGKAVPLVQGERIGGVAVETVLTDFGQFGVMLDRHVPQDAIIASTLDQLRPVFLNVPDKGTFFEEPLAKTGASDDVQIYGEIGLEYGSERSHGILRGLLI